MASKLQILMGIRRRIHTRKPDATKAAENRKRQAAALISTRTAVTLLHRTDRFKTKEPATPGNVKSSSSATSCERMEAIWRLSMPANQERR